MAKQSKVAKQILDAADSFGRQLAISAHIGQRTGTASVAIDCFVLAHCGGGYTSGRYHAIREACHKGLAEMLVACERTDSPKAIAALEALRVSADFVAAYTNDGEG